MQLNFFSDGRLAHRRFITWIAGPIRSRNLHGYGSGHARERSPTGGHGFGGTRFLGRRIVRQLLDDDFEVRAASRHPERSTKMFAPNAAGLTSIRADVQNETEVIAALVGSYAVVNCVSLYVERGRNTFHALHVEADRLSRLAQEAKVDRLVHISGIGADPASSSPYIGSKLHLHGLWIVTEAVTLLRHMANAGPCKVIGKEWDLFVGQHIQHLHACLR